MKNLITLALFALTTTIFGQDKNFTATADQLAITVVNLRKSAGNGIDSIGTGCFMEKGGKLYIITAAHIAKFMDTNSDVVIQGENSKPIKLFLFNLAMPIKWQYHNEADLAILELNPSEKIKKYLLARFIPYSTIDTSIISIPRNTQLTIIGFPLGFGVQEYFSPLTFRTFPSSGLITMPRSDTKKMQTFIILENPSVGGYSGGPVFDLGIIESGNLKMLSNKTRLYGFVHGTVSDNTGGKMATITPSFYIKDFFK